MGFYETLGVQPVINAMGTVTIYGGSLMPEEVLAAMADAGRSFVDLRELHRAAGQRIAALVGVEAAHVCACASAGISLMAAACMAGSDAEKMARLPNSRGMQNRFLIQPAHRNGFDHAIEVAGGQLVVTPPTTAALESALDAGAAAVFYTFAWFITEPVLPLSQVAELAHARGVPVIVDAAAEVPPAANLTRFLEEGADLVSFSGGKAIRGPQSSGLILGRPDLVAACAANDSPNVSGIARGMKVGKEEIAGLVKAVELYVQKDHAAEMAVWEQAADQIAAALGALPGIQAERQLPRGVGQLVPHVAVTWDPAVLERTVEHVTAQLLQGSPPVAVRPVAAEVAGSTHSQIWVCVNTLQPGQAGLVAQRLVDILRQPAI